MYYVYLTQNLLFPEKAYVGMTKRNKKSIITNKYLYLGSDKELQQDIKELGRNAFIRTNLFAGEHEKECKYWESFYVKTLKTHTSFGGYNKDFNGGSYPRPASKNGKKIMRAKALGRKHTPLAKEKNRCASKGKNNPMYGVDVYDIWLKKYGKEIADEKKRVKYEKISKSLTGKTRSEETCKKISMGKKGKPGSPHSPETRAKLSKSLKGKNTQPRTQEQKDKIRNTLLSKPKFYCKHCNRHIIKWYYDNYHGDLCKKNKNK